MGTTILAGKARKKYGEKLVGQVIVTEQFGYWPGGRARILGLYNDPAAPEIVLQVKAVPHNLMVSRAVAAGRLDSDEIGIFENEEIIIDETAVGVGAGD